ncbi:MAG: ABC transporter substrate-binding protein, partial [Nitrospiraceae bacterium]
GKGEGEGAGAILRVSQALGIFCLNRRSQETKRRPRIGWVAVISALLMAGPALASEGEDRPMKRRQQGILTGMPFMANLAPRTFVDDLGRKVYLPKTPTRVVSLAPNITEILFAIGSGDQVIAVTAFCDYPPEARERQKLGSAHLNLEAIVGLNPDLVVAPKGFVRPDVLVKLEQLKIKAFVLEAKTIEDIPSHIQTLGRMLGHSPVADELATRMRRDIAEIRERTQQRPRPRLLYVLNSNPLMTVGPGSFIHQLIELAGGANVAAGVRTGYPHLNMEEVLKEDPEIIVFPVGATEGIPESEQQGWLRWQTLSAVKHGRLHRIPSDLLNRPGPRVIQGLESLARIIHPEAYPEGMGAP